MTIGKLTDQMFLNEIEELSNAAFIAFWVWEMIELELVQLLVEAFACIRFRFDQHVLAFAHQH